VWILLAELISYFSYFGEKGTVKLPYRNEPGAEARRPQVKDTLVTTALVPLWHRWLANDLVAAELEAELDRLRITPEDVELASVALAEDVEKSAFAEKGTAFLAALVNTSPPGGTCRVWWYGGGSPKDLIKLVRGGRTVEIKEPNG
jgi:hypothetical protein